MDVSSFSTPDLKEIIAAFGIETEGLSREELENLLNTLQSSEERTERPTAGEMSDELNEAAFLSDSTIANLVDGHAFDDSQIEDSSLPVTAENQPVEPSAESNVEQEPMDVASAEEEEPLSEEQQRSIAMFCGITDADTAYAKTLLEAADWDVDAAVSLFFDGGGRQPSVTTFTPAIPPQSTEETSDNRVPPPPPDESEAVHREIASFEEFLRRHQQHGGAAHDESDEDYLSPPPFEQGELYDEDGVRRPDPVRIQRLISERSVRFEDDVLGRAEDPSVDWMFEPPNDISFPGTLEQARETAQAESKWVLVNIQSHLEFSSQLLNRDTWTNQDLRQIIGAHFVFMQRGHTSPQGKRLLSLYRISEDVLPQILIIEPNTGAKVFSYVGLVEPMELSVRLMDFLDKQISKQASKKPEPPKIAEQSSESAAQTEAEAEKPSTSEGKVLSPPVVAEKIVVDYGPVPALPAENDTTAIKVSIKLANGKSFMRRYLRTDTVRALFAVAVEQDAENGLRAFDLISRFPARNLSGCLCMTLEECDLAGGQVFHRWL